MEHNGNLGNPRPKRGRGKLPKLGPVTFSGTIACKRMKYSDDNGERDVLILFLTPEVLNGGAL